MVPALFFYQLVLVALVWLCLMLQWAWPSDRVTTQPTSLSPTPPRRKRRCEPKPFAGLLTKPHCAACDHAHAPYPRAFSVPTADPHDARTTPSGEHLHAFLP